MSKTCPNCAIENEPTNHFCAVCGHQFESQEPNLVSIQVAVTDARKLCSECHTVNEPTSEYCYHCGLKLPDHLYPRADVVGSPAGFWIRLPAYFIDEILIIVVAILIIFAFTGMDNGQAFDELTGVSGGLAGSLILVSVGAAYYTLFIGQWGQTVGKIIFGLKVVRTDGSRLSFWRSFGRYWAYLVSDISLGFGFIAIALSTQKRAWHDLIADTRVVNTRN